jgi:uncharacterized RDD family membrane protein YckC
VSDENQPPAGGEPGPGEPFDPKKTNVFRPGDYATGASSSGGSESAPPPPPWGAAPQGGESPQPGGPPPGWGAPAQPQPAATPPAAPSWGQPSQGASPAGGGSQGQPGAAPSWGEPSSGATSWEQPSSGAPSWDQPGQSSGQPSWGAPPQGGGQTPAWGAPGQGGSWNPNAPVGAPPSLASWGQRVGAALLDSLIFGGLMFAAYIPIFIIGFVLGLVSEVLALIVTSVLFLALIVAFFILVLTMEAGPYGQTPGKHVLGIKVVQQNGQMLSKGQAVGRYFSKMVSGLPCYLGFLWPLWDAERRTFHDMIMSTRVVTTPQQAPGIMAVIKAPFKGAA